MHIGKRRLEVKEVISTLNTLIATCRDGEQGLRTAAEHVKDPTVKALFKDLARERGSFAEELKQEVHKLGGVPEEGGSVSGALHRGWMDIKGSLAGRDDHSLLSEAERGEDVAVETYKDALGKAGSPSTHAMIERQYGRVKQAHDRVRTLRDSYKHSHA
jgi:uncharacterized protein (TIGR02284 family)